MAGTLSRQVYVLGRNASDRPGCQHAVDVVGADTTWCGVRMAGWSRFYTSSLIPVLFCRRCRNIGPRRNSSENSGQALAPVRPA